MANTLSDKHLQSDSKPKLYIATLYLRKWTWIHPHTHNLCSLCHLLLFVVVCLMRYRIWDIFAKANTLNFVFFLFLSSFKELLYLTSMMVGLSVCQSIGLSKKCSKCPIRILLPHSCPREYPTHPTSHPPMRPPTHPSNYSPNPDKYKGGYWFRQENKSCLTERVNLKNIFRF